MKQVRLEVYGRVQGVFFRKNVKMICDELGIRGYVRNRKDGSVLIVAQGNRKEMERLLGKVRESPGMSLVEEVRDEWSDSSETFSDFRIERGGNFFKDRGGALRILIKRFAGQSDGVVPGHVAIIPDGNRRWAKARGLEGASGHYTAGSYGNIETLFDEARKLGVKYVSIWAFSTENWKREKKEVDAVFDVVEKGVDKFMKDAEKNGIRFRHVGRKDRLPRKLLRKLEELERRTEKFNDFNAQLCLDYGGRDEIVRAVAKAGAGTDENDFSGLLDTAGIPEPDLIIRTGGEKRLSGFMLYQAAYSELYFSDKLFPAFGRADLRKAVRNFSWRVRRFGGDGQE